MSNVLERGIEAHQRGDLETARRLYGEAIGLAKHNLAVLAEQVGDHAQGLRLYREALEADPARDASAAALSLALLREGRYAEAWPLHERRRGMPQLNLPTPRAHWPEWLGDDLGGKRLAVIGEQGLGDQIMFARFLEPLRAMGAEPRFVCAPELASLLGGQATLARSEIDLWVFAMTLPHRLSVTLETIPPPANLPVARRGGGGIGVMASGNPKFAKNLQRTPPPDAQAALLAMGCDLRPEATGARDFLETAKIVAGLDLVVTIDTAVAHLAGSLGVPTWILLPAVDADWRWLRGRADSPWYPSVRLFRQRVPGDWPSVIEQVKRELA